MRILAIIAALVVAARAGAAPKSPSAAAPTVHRAEIDVRTAFSHAKHASRGARCAACHREPPGATELVAPPATTCATARCHDGAAAFPITEACTRCHRDPAPPSFKVARPTARFSHATHAQVQSPCASCHPLTPRGEVVTAGHAACATCHAEDFGRRAPTICGACHNGTEPWRQLVADRGPPEDTELGSAIDHARHAALPCARCHALTTPTRALRPPRGHRACLGDGCHAPSAGPEPRLDRCEACHRAGLVVARQRARVAAPWSVRTTFSHARHTARGTVECTACHDQLGGDVIDLATPRKAACAPCHDGATAFKLTGTACTRCHPGPPR